MGETVTTADQPEVALVEIAFAENPAEAEMIQGLLKNGGIPSLLRPTGLNGPLLGIGRCRAAAVGEHPRRRRAGSAGRDRQRGILGRRERKKATELWALRRLRENLAVVAQRCRDHLRRFPASPHRLRASSSSRYRLRFRMPWTSRNRTDLTPAASSLDHRNGAPTTTMGERVCR